MTSPITVGGGWRGSGFSILLRAVIPAFQPSLWGILVYSDETLMVASRHSPLIGVDSIRLMKSVVSLMKDSSDFIIGCSQMSTNWEMFSVTLLTLETIGLTPMGLLCIFFRKYYSWEVLCFFGGHTEFRHVFVENFSSLEVLEH